MTERLRLFVDVQHYIADLVARFAQLRRALTCSATGFLASFRSYARSFIKLLRA
jgi:hypothetical protein